MSYITEKLYYKDAYISEFSARIVSSSECEGGYDIVLDRTAFFPEEGGQYSDKGFIEAARVLHVYEACGAVHHVTDALPSGDSVNCRVDFDERFEKMQIHTAEHILSGIIHTNFGLDNVGFHLGADEVTFDVSKPMTREQLDFAFSKACEAVFKNLKIETIFPTAQELENIKYRSKLDIKENVRLVKIGDIDICACCAPHVLATGEIGLIRLIRAERHRGGMRIWMSAGRRAVRESLCEHDSAMKISAMLSVPPSDIVSALEKYMSDTEDLKYQLREARRVYAESLADSLYNIDGDIVYYIENCAIEELRTFVNRALPKVSGRLVALCGVEGDYKYIIASNSIDVSREVKDYNSALSGRGGGRGMAVQGSFCASLSEIRKYFEK